MELIPQNDDFTKAIIEGMQWSFSRVNGFETCPYAWYRNYILKEQEESGFFSSYGTFIHEMLESYYKDELPPWELVPYYEENFMERVPEDAPPNKYTDIKDKYYNQGRDYFMEFTGVDTDKYEILGVEKKVKFQVGKYRFVGCIDLLLRDKEDGKLIVADHKTAVIKKLKNGSISNTDKAHFEEFKRQLYLYSLAILNEFGEFPKALRWHIIRENDQIEIPFNTTEYEDALKWAEETADKICNTKDFPPNIEQRFFCDNICGYRNCGCEYKIRTNYYKE